MGEDGMFARRRRAYYEALLAQKRLEMIRKTMLRLLIDLHLRHRWLVLVGLGGLVVPGLWSLTHISIDAFPDLTNNQVVVVTEARGMAPIEVEQLVTSPLRQS